MRPNQRGTLPNRHLVAFLTFVALLPLVYYVPPWLAQHVLNNQLVVTFLAVAIIVPIISYVALPGMLWILRLLKG